MDIFGLLKNTNAYGKFVSLARAGKIPHAALLYFKDGYAAANMLKLFACAAVCRSEEKPCLTCDDCRRILNGRHIDCKTYPKGKGACRGYRRTYRGFRLQARRG